MRLLGRVAAWIPQQIREPLLFELRSLYGRTVRRSIPLSPAGRNYLNLGSGTFCFDDFLNVDMHTLPGMTKPHSRFYGADLRHPLRLPDESIDGIFSEHTFEHLTFAQASRLFRECMRVMKPGARIRVVVPDLSLFLGAYSRNDEKWFREWERLYFTESEDPQRRARRLLTPMNAISFVTQEYGHLSSWDFTTMERELQRAGFTGITKCGYRQGSNPDLLRDLDSDDRRFVSLYIEAVKPGGG